MTEKKLINLDEISEEHLLNTRVCDLPLKIEGTWLDGCVKELYQELDNQGIVFKPVCYLADEWLTPENETCIGIPFYLAHPALVKLEKKFMIDAEGGTENWCMKLLRHETGHAICYAYQFHKRKKWQNIFGPPSLTYGDTYKFRPYSKNYVRHLDGFYAQCHPDEDFVETFAVWLTPHFDWRVRYKSWKAAYAKLEYVDELMMEIRGKEPPYKSRKQFWRQSTLKYSLNSYYKRKRHFSAEDFPDFHDAFLKKVFTAEGNAPEKIPSVLTVIKKYRKDIIYSVSRSSGERKYIINDLLKGIEKRSHELNLFVPDEKLVAINLTAYVTSLAMHYLYTGRYRGDKKKKK